MIIGRTGPKNPVLALDLFIADTEVISDAGARGHAQLVENLLWVGKGEPMRPVQRLRNVLNDTPIFPRFTGTLHGLVNLDDAALGGCDYAFVFFLQRTGQDHIRIMRAVIEEEIDHDVEFQLLKHAPDKIIVRQRDNRVEAYRQEPGDFAAIDLAEHLIGIDAGPR